MKVLRPMCSFRRPWLAMSSLTLCSNLVMLFFMTSWLAKVIGSPSSCLGAFSCLLGEQERTVDCSDSGIVMVPVCLNPRLVSLSLHNTQIHTLYLASLRYYADLKFVNLSHNRIHTIEKETFECQNKLEGLHLADNKISHLDPEIFVGLRNLTVLSLRNNLLEEVPDGVFQQLPRLENLDISHNRITTLGSDMLRGLPRLTVLHLSQNRLKATPAASLNQVSHLAEFSIGGNLFTKIHKQDLKSLRHLVSLDLSSTDFSSGISPDAFEYIPGLRSLKLNYCQLKTIPSELLSTLPQLEKLEMSQNLFTQLPDRAFQANRKMISLAITGSPYLERISPGALQDNLILSHVDFSRNPHLAFIPPKGFDFLTQLSFLDLHGNHLQYIPIDAVSWSDVPTWHLHGNPITCNCSSAWLRKMLIESNRTASPTLLCAHPPKLSGVPLIDTEMKDLSCGIDAFTQVVVITLSICGLVLIVVCVAFFLLYRNRRPCVRQLLKGHKWRGGGRGANNHSYDSEYPCIKPVPVTEL